MKGSRGGKGTRGASAADDPGRALLAAFRAIRYPDRPADSETAWQGYRDVLRAAAAGGVHPEQMRDATCAALQRWQNRDMVNPRSVLRHLDALLEPETPDRPQTRRQVVRERNKAFLDDAFGIPHDDSDDARASRARPVQEITLEMGAFVMGVDTEETTA